MIGTNKTTLYEDEQRSKTIQSWVREFEYKSYYEQNVKLYYFALVGSFVCQILTIFSSWNFVLNLIDSDLKVFYTAFLLVCIEVTKYVLFSNIFKTLFVDVKLVNIPFAFFAVLICTASIYASITGAEQIGNDKTQLIAINNEMRLNALNVENAFRSESESIKKQISEIKNRNTWKNNMWITGKDKAILERNELRLIQLSEDKRNALNKIETEKRNELSKKENELSKNGTRYKLAFAFFDLIFIVLSAYVWYFRFRTVFEVRYSNLDNSKIEQKEEVKKEQVKTVILKQEETESDNKMVAKIGFKTENKLFSGNRICGSCGKAFVYKTDHQKFCSNACRMENFKSKSKC